MIRKSRGYLMMAALLMIPGVMTLASPKNPGLGELLEQARTDDYVMPDASDLLKAEDSFRHWLAADDRLAAAQYLGSPDQVGLGFKAVAVPRSDIVALTETDNERQGRGFFAARREGGAPLLIQAPHQYYDLRTGAIARKLFLEGNAMAAAWNTTHRYQGDDTDLVHIADSYLHALSRAFADVHPGGRILQLHGFSSAKRESRAGREARAILSDGSGFPPASLARLADCLSQRLDIRALLYPRDVRELGATTNTLAADLRRRGFDGFVHLELDVGLRKRLVRDVDARNSLMQCVAETHL
ncbi:hypothetical protein SAMN05216203_0971 [Marinobacter daqiaonensis]|uniref:Uncharacterized protein n=1 Tax=Marinobacter daqiaonensis TaxID=650891 RepID=A0A1I6H7Y3_9GAMM|nr:hypothetical protein [Marinobacter daqiaonensis]SFR50490.1 hypothetical protein SAMN05216203_0971 [Marinobacter daqiaonensis]